MNKPPRQFDTVKILKTVEGVTEVNKDSVFFPAGTKGAVIDIYPDGYLVEILWQPTPLTDDGLLVFLHEDELEVAWRAPEKQHPPPKSPCSAQK